MRASLASFGTIALISLAIGAADAQAATMQIQNGLTVAGDTYAGTETAWIHSGVPNNVVGTNALIRVGFQDGSPDTVFRTLVRFGALSHFAGVTSEELGFTSAQITGARITLFKRAGEGSGSAQLHILDSVDQGWTESFTTWNKRRTDGGTEDWSQGPGIGSAYGAQVDTSKAFSSADAVGTAMVFELTGNTDAMQIVKDWFSGADTSGTFFLRAASESGTGNHYYDWQSEHTAAGSSVMPMLEIDYVPEPASAMVISMALGSGLLMRRRSN